VHLHLHSGAASLPWPGQAPVPPRIEFRLGKGRRSHGRDSEGQMDGMGLYCHRRRRASLRSQSVWSGGHLRANNHLPPCWQRRCLHHTEQWAADQTRQNRDHRGLTYYMQYDAIWASHVALVDSHFQISSTSSLRNREMRPVLLMSPSANGVAHNLWWLRQVHSMSCTTR
jgi:hypothetical protein